MSLDEHLIEALKSALCNEAETSGGEDKEESSSDDSSNDDSDEHAQKRQKGN